ncbi:MAG: tetratricopeptide repeat protein [Desulfobacteraceae bacterium]|nr:tetratricopeptide repeat protein [Desulfobacteraceae bacterium]
MDPLSISADTLFLALENQSYQAETLATQALSNGIDKYMDEDYEAAAVEFKRSLGLSPYSQYAVDATKHLAQTYLKLDETEKAIDAYKQTLKLLPQRDDLHLALGNLFMAEDRSGEAVESYEQAVRIYDDPVNRYALGQGYLSTGRYNDAENQFNKIISRSPDSYSGYFGLGQTLSAQKKYTAAIEAFENALSRNRDFNDAYVEMGYVYANAGKMEKAEDILTTLEHKDPDLASLLKAYIQKTTKPQITTAWATGTFHFYLPAKTQISDMSSYLSEPNASHSLTMEFQFNKEMNRETVEDPFNWTIKRASGLGPAENYNYGLGIEDTEVQLSLYPSDVYYDSDKLTATVRFSINQNAEANATIDPVHIVFSFNGQDADGNPMDPKFDQYMGFSGHF